MLLSDSHTHSKYSFDSDQTVDELCESAIANGVSRIALTDHYDIDCILDGYYDDYDAVSAARDVERCREKYAGALDIVFGIEIGQPHLRDREAHEFIRRHGIEFVISSVHNLDRVPDFIFINYKDVPQPLINSLYHRYIDELCGAASFDGAHTLAHITYPCRYIMRDGRSIDLREFYDHYLELFRIMRERGIALELNTSGIRKGYGLSPTVELLDLYRESGGELVSCGSDTHIVGDCGKNVRDCIALLAQHGFRYITYPCHGGSEQVKIEL